MKIQMVPLSKLSGYDRNSRTHSADQVAQIAASIQEFGFTNPLLVNDDFRIIAGHGRLMAATDLGLEEVPVIVLDYLSDVQQRALVIADNKIALNAGWDDDMLRSEMRALSETSFDMDVIGFDLEELDALLSVEEPEEPPELNGDPDNAPSAREEYVSKPGDVWVLGDHRLMNGDSTEMGDVGILANGELIDCCWTDPPYNVNYESKAGTIKNDNMSGSKFVAFLTDAFVAASSVLKDGAPTYVAHADTEGKAFRTAFEDAGFYLSGSLVWVKPALVLGRSDYQWRHEPILYGWKTGAAHKWYGERNKTTVFEHEGESIQIMPDGTLQIALGDQTIIVEGSELKMRSVTNSVIRADKPRKNGDHPTMKPVGLIQRQLANSTKKGDLVLDVFGGSGSTLIACEIMGLSARLMELDPRFADVIVRRWQELTGRDAYRESDNAKFNDLEPQPVD